MNSAIKIACYLLLSAMLFVRCSINSSSVSDGSEAGNAVVIGSVVYTNGASAGNVQVKLIPTDYNPVTDSTLPEFLIDTTDINGDYSFSFLDTGSYNVLALYRTCNIGLLHKDIWVGNDTIDIFTDTLKATGAIKIILPDTVDTVNGYVFIEGTDIYQKINAKTVYLDFVPAGVTPKIKYANISISEILVDSITVVSNDTVIQASVLLITKFKNSEFDTISFFIAEKLKEVGLSVKIVDDSTVLPADTAGMSAVIFSSTAYERPRLGTIFRDMPLPLLNMECNLLKHIGMTDTVEGVDYGWSLPEIKCEIYDSLHSIVGDLLGTVTMYSDSSDIEWGKPGTAAQKITVLPGTIDSAAIFCYEKDAEMVGGKAPAKRGAFLLHGKDIYKLTNDGWYLFRNMVKWLFE